MKECTPSAGSVRVVVDFVIALNAGPVVAALPLWCVHRSPPRLPPDGCCGPLIHPVPVSPLGHLHSLVGVGRTIGEALIGELSCLPACCAVCTTAMISVAVSRGIGVMLFVE